MEVPIDEVITELDALEGINSFGSRRQQPIEICPSCSDRCGDLSYRIQNWHTSWHRVHEDLYRPGKLPYQGAEVAVAAVDLSTPRREVRSFCDDAILSL